MEEIRDVNGNLIGYVDPDDFAVYDTNRSLLGRAQALLGRDADIAWAVDPEGTILGGIEKSGIVRDRQGNLLGAHHGGGWIVLPGAKKKIGHVSAWWWPEAACAAYFVLSGQLGDNLPTIDVNEDPGWAIGRDPYQEYLKARERGFVK